VPAHRPVDPDLLHRALLPRGAAHRLTRATAKTPEEKRAVERAKYLRRLEARTGATPREAAGHAPPGSTLPTATFVGERVEGGPPTLLVKVTVSRADVHRVGKADAQLRKLENGRVDGATYRRRMERYAPIHVLGPPELAGQWRFVADPDAALGLAQVAHDEGIEDWIDSGRSRPLPRLRTLRRPPKGRRG